MWFDKEEAEIHRVVDLPSGNKVHFRQYPPHGMWRISFDKGQLPAELNSAFTSYGLAEAAWKAYYDKSPHLQVPPPMKRLKEALKED